MKLLALALAVFVAGCANTQSPGAAARLAKFQQQSDEISAREKKCIKSVNASIDDQGAPTAANPDSLTNSSTPKPNDDIDRARTACTTNADRERKELAASARAEYEAAAQQEGDRAALISILTTSRPR